METQLEATHHASAALALNGAMRPRITADWHERSRAFGLDESQPPDFSGVPQRELSQVIEANRSLQVHAVPVMETLYEQIRNTHSMVILTDHRGLILHSLGDVDFLEKAGRVALRSGVLWSEESKGTNAIGTALRDGRPTLVHAGDHFLTANRFLTCSCAPIVDNRGVTIGALDVSGDQASYHQHTMALVRMSVQMIENHLFADDFADAVRVQFHTRPEFVGTLVEGIVAFDGAGRFLGANRSAEFQLGLTRSTLERHTVSSLFGIPMSTLFDHGRRQPQAMLTLCMHNGVAVHARASLRASGTMVAPMSPSNPKAPTVSARTRWTLDTLSTGDPVVERAIAKVRQVQGHDIPILVLGETGTGKELFAQAIHHASTRRDGPFVAVNCAAIPDALIEAELFGYEDGAFTGARRKGAIGKLQLAHGGTLFLDEIGDMPVNLQARLLRVLQDRTVNPLGSVRAIPIDIAVVCATNRDLPQMIRDGAFRQDLYYRLNALVIKLPPLRTRSDLDTLVARILADGDGPATVTPEVLSLFARASWPGNVRQLANVLRTARIMAHGESAIAPEHLPDDLVDELGPETVVDAQASLADLQAAAVIAAMKRHGGNVSAVARALGVSRNTVYRRLSGRDDDVT